MEYHTDVPEQIVETLTDRLPRDLPDEDYRIEYNNQNKGYLFVRIPEENRYGEPVEEGRMFSVVLRAVTSYGRTEFGGVVFPEEREELREREYRILFSFE